MTYDFLRCILATLCNIRFQKQLSFEPLGQDAQPWWGRKQFYCINALITADQHFIVSVDAGKRGNIAQKDGL